MPSKKLRYPVLCYLVRIWQSVGSRLAICEMLTVATEKQTCQLIQLGQRASRTSYPYFYVGSHRATRVQLRDEKSWTDQFKIQDCDKVTWTVFNMVHITGFCEAGFARPCFLLYSLLSADSPRMTQDTELERHTLPRGHLGRCSGQYKCGI